MHAVASGGTGCALRVSGDTTSPVSSPVHIDPVDTTPSVPVKGDLWPNAVTGKFSSHDGTNEDRYIAQEYVLTAAESQNAPATYTAKKTIDANVLRAGSVVRIKAILRCTASTLTAGEYLTATMKIGATTIATARATVSGVPGDTINGIVGLFNVLLSISSIGAGGTFNSVGFMTSIYYPASTGFAEGGTDVAGSAINTTIADDITVSIAVSAHAATCSLDLLLVDLT